MGNFWQKVIVLAAQETAGNGGGCVGDGGLIAQMGTGCEKMVVGVETAVHYCHNFWRG